LHQTFRNIEVIVVDDGSTDKTRFIVADFSASDSRVRLFSTINRGVAMARNLGIENARGTHVAFLDADDLWHPTKIDCQVNALNDHVSDPTWAGVYVFNRFIDEEDRVVGSGEVTVDCRGYVLARNFVMKFVGNGSNLLVRREAALAVGGFDPSFAKTGLGGCEDLDFELKLAARYRIDAVRLFLVGYRSYTGNMSSDSVRMAKSAVATIAQHVKRNPSLPRRIRRWGVGDCYRYAFLLLLYAQEFKLATRAFWMMLVNDPILSIYVLVRDLPLMMKRKLTPLLPPVATAARKFLSMDPEDGLDRKLAPIPRMRQKQLAADDRTLEQKVFCK